MQPEFTQKGFAAAEALIRGIGARGLDARPALDATTNELIDAEKQRFGTLGSPKASTEENKARDRDPRVRAHADESGVATGELRKFLTTKGRGAQPVKLTKDELVFGVPGHHRLSPRAAGLAKIGKNPVVGRDLAERTASAAIQEHLDGDDAD